MSFFFIECVINVFYSYVYVCYKVTESDLTTKRLNIYLHVARQRPLVAGSVGPYGACLCDGSEYTGNYVDKVSKQVNFTVFVGFLRGPVFWGFLLI